MPLEGGSPESMYQHKSEMKIGVKEQLFLIW